MPVEHNGKILPVIKNLVRDVELTVNNVCVVLFSYTN